MELVPGESLAHRLRDGALPVREALELGHQIADGLAAAHAGGIIHRDLKPANIQVTPEGKVKILDFGLAKSIPPGESRSGGDAHAATITSPAHMTQAGIVLGTAAYMSPEQAKGFAVDRRADIWAFGCVLFEMLTGRRLFDGPDVSEVLANVLRAEVDWTLLPRDVSPVPRAFLERCLHRDLRQRLAGHWRYAPCPRGRVRRRGGAWIARSNVVAPRRGGERCRRRSRPRSRASSPGATAGPPRPIPLSRACG